MNTTTLIDNIRKNLKSIEYFKYSPFPIHKEINQDPRKNVSNIMTKDYFYTMVYPLLEGISDKDFSVIYGDFNKLNYINQNFSEKVGDIALSEALSLFPSLLPSNTILVRLGGDEVLFVLFDIDKEKSDKFISSITDSMEHLPINSYLKEQNSAYPLSITLCAVDSSEGDFQTVFKLAEKQVTQIKHDRKIAIESSDYSSPSDKEWDPLNKKIEIFIQNHIANSRFSKDYHYSLEDVKKEALFIIDILNDMLDHPEQFPTSVPVSIQENLPLQDLYEEPSFLPTLEKIYTGRLFLEEGSENAYSFPELVQMNYITSEILENLIRDSHTHLLNKSYLKQVLSTSICDTHSSYQAIYFSDIGIKKSNSAYNHELTDQRIKKTANLLLDSLSQKLNFNNHSFEFSPWDNFVIDQGGGNYVALINHSNKISEKDVQDILLPINTTNLQEHPEDSGFKISYAMCDDIDISNPTTLLHEIRELKKTCNKNKDLLKSDYLNDPDTILSLRKELHPCLEYYTQNIDRSLTNLNSRKQLLQNTLSCFLNEISYYDQSKKIQAPFQNKINKDEPESR